MDSECDLLASKQMNAEKKEPGCGPLPARLRDARTVPAENWVTVTDASTAAG